jgi:copper(I)-binding protein
MKRLFAFTLLLLLPAGAGAQTPGDPDRGAIATTAGVIYMNKAAGDPTMGFFSIVNTGSETDTLTSVSCLVADTTALVDTNGKALARLAVPAGQTVSMSAKGPHLVLQATHFVIGKISTVPCTASFANAGAIQVFLYAASPPSS